MTGLVYLAAAVAWLLTAVALADPGSGAVLVGLAALWIAQPAVRHAYHRLKGATR